MSKPLSITLRGKDGEDHEYTEDYVPAKFIPKILNWLDKTEGPRPVMELLDAEAALVAEIFTDKAVTKTSIKSGLNAVGYKDTLETILFKVGNVNPNRARMDPSLLETPESDSTDSSEQ